MGKGVEKSGGSAANTIVGVAGFGGRAAFIGKVKDDVLGKSFTTDIRKSGVAFDRKTTDPVTQYSYPAPGRFVAEVSGAH